VWHGAICVLVKQSGFTGDWCGIGCFHLASPLFKPLLLKWIQGPGLCNKRWGEVACEIL
jgi:hypothetical protein